MNKTKIVLAAFATCVLPVKGQQIDALNRVIDCGQVVYREPVSVEFELKNTSARPVNITDVETSCGCTSADYPHETLKKGAEAVLKVTYDARQMGHFNKQVAVFTEGSDKPLVLSMKGIVVAEVVDFSGDYPFQMGELRTDLANIEFDDVNRGDQPMQKIHIKNASSQTAQPVIMHLPNYLKAEVSPSLIPPGHSGVATLTLDSRLVTDDGLTQTNVYLGFQPGDKVASEKEISVSAILLPDFKNLTSLQRASAPQLQLSTTELNLGAFNGKKRLKGEIVLKNTGKTQLDISNLQVFTTGVEVSLGNTHIAPGTEEKLKVKVTSSGLRRARSKPRILMITNDPTHAKVVIDIIVQ